MHNNSLNWFFWNHNCSFLRRVIMPLRSRLSIFPSCLFSALTSCSPLKNRIKCHFYWYCNQSRPFFRNCVLCHPHAQVMRHFSFHIFCNLNPVNLKVHVQLELSLLKELTNHEWNSRETPFIVEKSCEKGAFSDCQESSIKWKLDENCRFTPGYPQLGRR